MQQLVTKALLEYAAGHHIFCPNQACRQILDCKDTVIVHSTGGDLTVCSDCWDKAVKNNANKLLHPALDVTDGRDAFGGDPTMAARAYLTALKEGDGRTTLDQGEATKTINRLVLRLWRRGWVAILWEKRNKNTGARRYRLGITQAGRRRVAED